MQQHSNSKQTIIIYPINYIPNFNKYNVPLNICNLGNNCSEEATYKYYSKKGPYILACDKHAKGPMFKISETKCINNCPNQPIYFSNYYHKYCKLHMLSLFPGHNKKSIIFLLKLLSYPPLTIDEYEALF
jgi:hypothetical protein